MLRSRLNDALKDAMKAKESLAVSTLRLILAALKDRDIAGRSKGNSDGISEDEILEMLQKMVRQRRDSIEMYTKAGRDELAEREANEIVVIEQFLPQALGEDEMRAAIDTVIAELDASSIKDMGRVMAELKQRFAGQMDFGKASATVKELLA
ncbi:GatB/YqeY domain-containing protein [Denitrobaculum tricleocarpae]|uniref:GatB/YqeY domain-containing protein n=1 Tax=Denitrobaculum tricleocarpae TaxID=2591009 RepID=A0A545SZ74_9PROT|nr:GatB/YqeY domain-containing protein [Denitrobaculum tricleocarpae]TQV70250.1 GatB/YqeY domain-containing protein [Denitrobaculum tricleocarpae]